MTHHPDAPAIDRIGAAAIEVEFGITRQAVSYWRRKGVPWQHREQMVKLAAAMKLRVPELRERR